MNTKVDDKTASQLEAGLTAELAKPVPYTPNPERNRQLFTASGQPAESGYGELERILKLALHQSSQGKGRERHAFSPTGIFMPWDQQPILANARQVGPGGPAQQVMKKAGESVTMAGNKNIAGAKAEALGAIVYAAALYKLYEEMEQ